MSTLRSSRGQIVGAILAFTLSLVLYTRNNAFPFFYHGDEAGKVEQLLTGDWNFHHPLLMLTATGIVADRLGIEKSRQNVVVIGRWVSAFFSATAVAALTMLAFRFGGIAGACTVGLLLALHHQLFELSHYMKEDTALLAGIALSFLAISVFWEKPSPRSSAFLGAACAVALSGKYVGAVMIPLALAVLFVGRNAQASERQVPGKPLLVFVLALLATIALVNFRVWQNLPLLSRSFGREVDLVVHGQQGMTRRVPHSLYWNVFRDNSNPVLWAFLLWHLVAFWQNRRERSLPEYLVTIFPFAFTLALSFSPKTNDRYFLPATAMFLYLAGLGAIHAARWLEKFMRPKLALALCIGVAVGSELPSFCEYWSAFQRDDHAELRAWIGVTLPRDAVILEDSRVNLPVTGDARDAQRQAPLAQKVILYRDDRPELYTLESVKQLGVTHVIVSESDYGRFFLKSLKPRAGYNEQFTRSKAFYEDLFREGKLLWERPRSTVLYLHPGLRVYCISQTPE